jgi:hypothetical protein
VGLKMPKLKGSPKTGGRKPGSLNKATADIKRLAQAHGEELIEKLLNLARNAENESAQIAAIKELLDRGFGRPTQHIAGDAEAAPVKQVINVITGVPRGDDGPLARPK